MLFKKIRNNPLVAFKRKNTRNYRRSHDQKWKSNPFRKNKTFQHK